MQNKICYGIQQTTATSVTISRFLCGLLHELLFLKEVSFYANTSTVKSSKHPPFSRLTVHYTHLTHLASRPLISPDDIRFFVAPCCGDVPRCGCGEVHAGDGWRKVVQLTLLVRGNCVLVRPLRDVDLIFGLYGNAVLWTAPQTGNGNVQKITINDTINLFLKLQSAFW